MYPDLPADIAELCDIADDRAASLTWRLGAKDELERRDAAGLSDADALAYLVADGGDLAVPCSRYGSTSADCAPVALAVARIVADETGTPITRETLDHSMSLVVNDHDDPLELIASHGSAEQRELIADPLYDQWAEVAQEIGRDAGRAAGSWASDGTTSAEHARHVLDLIEAGDPEADDYLPAYPSLSGQWADDPTPDSLHEQITGISAADDSVSQDLIDRLAEAWEEGVAETFQDACETALRKYAPELPDAFQVHLELGGAAMQSAADVSAALRRIAARIERADTLDSGTVADENGNTVGSYGSPEVA